ncbi:septal ring lytic transglycosylase RlpA family protein [Thermobifida halotolerans]|nr:septal ring lytic transglycosylase RlpA family protein [Thermobifida halotolerans]
MGRRSLSRLLARRPSRAVATAAAVAVLTAGGAAAVTFGDLDASADQAVSAAVIPEAPPIGQASAAPLDERERQRATQVREEAVADGVRTARVDAAAAQQAPAASEAGQEGASGQAGQCEASMYGDPQPTASGETFDPTALTAAHKTLPFGTMVEVTNIADGRSVTVRINDRGPYVAGRCLDLSTAAFSAIASPSQGVIQVSWKVVD